MAFENFFRRDRERYGGDRNPGRQRSTQDWRDENRGQAPDRGYGLGAQGDDQRRGSSSGDYRNQQDERYGRSGSGGQFSGRGYGDQDYGRQDYGRHDYGREEYGRQSGRGGEWRDEGQSYGSEFGARYGQSNYGLGSEESRGSFGSGGYGRDMDYGRRGALGYGGYGGMGGAETGSSAYGADEQFRGRGPRGYRRSDDRIREDICDMLTDDPHLDASNLEVTVKECEVTLSGYVNSREDKRRAEDLIERISGVKDVHNTLRVSSEQRGGSSEQRFAGTEQRGASEQRGGTTTEGQGASGQTARH